MRQELFSRTESSLSVLGSNFFLSFFILVNHLQLQQNLTFKFQSSQILVLISCVMLNLQCSVFAIQNKMLSPGLDADYKSVVRSNQLESICTQSSSQGLCHRLNWN